MSLTNSSSLPRSEGSRSLKIHPERPNFSRFSLRNPNRDEQVSSTLRQRTFSASEDAPEDTIAELVSPPPSITTTPMTPGGKLQPTPVDRRNSSPQINIGSIFSQAFQKKSALATKLKEEIHSAHSSHQSDRLNNSNSKISVMANQNPLLQSRILPSTEKLINGDSPQFVLSQCSMKPQSADSIRFRCNTNLCIAKIYRELFYDHFHMNYYGESGAAGPFLASARYISKVKSQGDSYAVHLIIRTPENNHYMVEGMDEYNEEHVLEILFYQANVISISNYGAVGDPRANEKIYQFDKTNDERQNCKIGVIFQRRDQTDESDILSNDELSDEMIEFFELIAERISLKGFDKYRADLDIKEDLHGDHSYYTEFNNHEIMFNIAPIIPSFPVNGQYIERKSLVGNAFVCIVFQEMDAIFNPNDILGRVTQIYITVQPIVIDRELFYKIGIWHRNDITSVMEPPGGIFRSDASFCRYFLTLLLNCVQEAIESPNLRGRVFEARQTSRSDELKKLITQLARSPLPDFQQNQEIFSFSSSSRPESFVGSSSTGEARTSPVSAKKGGIQKRIKKIFSARSASISSPSINESNNSQPSFTLETKGKESVKRTKSMRPVSTPGPTSRPIPITSPPQVSIQPATPGSSSSSVTRQNSALDTDEDEQTINSAVFFVPPRHRSNSSPDDSVYTNPHFTFVSTDQLDSRNSSSPDDDEIFSDDDEKPTEIRRVIVSSIENL